jgi:hypothetical protein
MKDTLEHRIAACGEGRAIWEQPKRLMARMCEQYRPEYLTTGSCTLSSRYRHLNVEGQCSGHWHRSSCSAPNKHGLLRYRFSWTSCRGQDWSWPAPKRGGIGWATLSQYWIGGRRYDRIHGDRRPIGRLWVNGGSIMIDHGSGWVYTTMGAWHRWSSHVIGGRVQEGARMHDECECTQREREWAQWDGTCNWGRMNRIVAMKTWCCDSALETTESWTRTGVQCSS